MFALPGRTLWATEALSAQQCGLLISLWWLAWGYFLLESPAEKFRCCPCPALTLGLMGLGHGVCSWALVEGGVAWGRGAPS